MRPTTLTEEILRKYPNEAFVETGTADGAAVDIALSCGFKNIMSIEIDSERQMRNGEAFKIPRDCGRVKLLIGDSSIVLKRIIEGLRKVRITFWLDAHYEENGPIGIECPLYEELDLIAQSSIKTHTILIDDMRIMGTKKWGKEMDISIIQKRLLSINPKYQFRYEDTIMAKNDILVATI